MLVFLETAIVFFGNFTTRLPSGRQQMKKTPRKALHFHAIGLPGRENPGGRPAAAILENPQPL